MKFAIMAPLVTAILAPDRAGQETFVPMRWPTP
jgi:hypothetical protein